MLDLVTENLIKDRFPITLTLECTRKADGSHFHNYTQMWYILSGTLIQTIGNNVYVQHPGSLVVIPPYTRHNIDTSKSDDTPVFVSISFIDSFLTDFGYKYFSFTQSNVHFEGYEIPEYTELLGGKREIADILTRRMHAEFSKHYDMDFDILRDLLIEFINLFRGDKISTGDITLSKERADAISAAVAYLLKNYSKKITIDELCRVSAMSRRVFTNSFKIVTGCTMVDFLTRMRLDKSRYFILFTDKSCTEIAETCGFCDKAHFSRTFLKYYGMSPIQFRNSRREEAIILDRERARRWNWIYDENTEQA